MSDGIFGFLQVLFHTPTPEECEAFRREYDPTPAEIAQDRRDDAIAENQIYIEHISAHPQRRSWYIDEGMTLCWEEYVTYRNGKEVIVSSGSDYAGFSGFGG